MDVPEEKTVRENLRDRATWVRFGVMIVLGVAFYLIETLVAAVAIFQLLLKLTTGRVSEPLRDFGRGLAAYLQAVVAYLTFHSEDRPFPFAPWPRAETGSPPRPRRKAKGAGAKGSGSAGPSAGGSGEGAGE